MSKPTDDFWEYLGMGIFVLLFCAGLGVISWLAK